MVDFRAGQMGAQARVAGGSHHPDPMGSGDRTGCGVGAAATKTGCGDRFHGDPGAAGAPSGKGAVVAIDSPRMFWPTVILDIKWVAGSRWPSQAPCVMMRRFRSFGWRSRRGGVSPRAVVSRCVASPMRRRRSDVVASGADFDSGERSHNWRFAAPNLSLEGRRSDFGSPSVTERYLGGFVARRRGATVAEKLPNTCQQAALGAEVRPESDQDWSVWAPKRGQLTIDMSRRFEGPRH